LHDIERFIKREIAVEVIAGFEPDPNARPQPIQLRSQEHRGQPRHQQGKRPSAPGGRSGGKPANPGQRNGSQRTTQGTSTTQRTQKVGTTTSSTSAAVPRTQRAPGVRTAALLGQPAANSAARSASNKRRSGQR
jgi:ATP-dependent RNA helicase RhlE